MTKANAHQLFFRPQKKPCFLTQITISQEEHHRLVHARQEIRSTLKAMARGISFDRQFWVDGKIALERYGENRELVVKFMTQGSFAYRTLNEPAQTGYQEIDLDDGMYVPVQFLDDKPSIIAKKLFSFVEYSLAPLCARCGWTLKNHKSTCVRIQLWQGAHIDLPIYSIPEQKFAHIVESVAFDSKNFAMETAASIANFRLPSDKIMLANRDGRWIPSDPMELNDWVLERIQEYGGVYRRLCRFFKAWRDYVWRDPKLSSICIMVAIDRALKDPQIQVSEVRDDELILEISSRLPKIFHSDIANPVVVGAVLNEWDHAVRSEIIEEVKKLNALMQAALNETFNPNVVVDKITKAFGNRIPHQPDLVTISPNSLISEIRKAPAATVAAPRVIPTTSG